MKFKIKLGCSALTLAMGITTFAQVPVINSFSQNGQLRCTNLPAGGIATVEWASTLTGPWRTNWTGLDAVTADSNGVIQVSVPMFYRVRGPATNNVNQAPIAVDDADNITEDTALIRATSVYRTNDSDSNGDPLTITAVSAPINGTVSLVGTNITFTPFPNFFGTAGYDYTLSDGALTDVGHVTVTVTPVNDSPVAVDDYDSTGINTNLVRDASVYLTNDTDIDSTLSITAVSNPVNGTIYKSGTTITFVPTADFSGTAGFDYTVTDGMATDTGHVSVTVN
jgi:hypothetical protein